MIRVTGTSIIKTKDHHFQLRDKIKAKGKRYVLSRMRRHISRVRGSDPYWAVSRRGDLEAVIHQEGPGTYFGTKSAAEFLWPDVHQVLQLPDNWTRKMKKVNDSYIHLIDWWIDRRDVTFDKCLGEVLKMDWFWKRSEYSCLSQFEIVQFKLRWEFRCFVVICSLMLK